MEFSRATGESLKVVHAVGLSISFGNKPGLIPIHWTIKAILQVIDASTTHNIFGFREQLPSSTRNKSIYLLIHYLLPCRYQYSLLIWPGYRCRRQRHDKLAKRRIKTIIRNKMKNRIIITRLFTFGEGNRNITIRGKCWWLRRWTFRWRGGVGRNWFRDKNFWLVSVVISEIPKRLWCRWLSCVCRWQWRRDIRTGAGAENERDVKEG